jgi:flavin-dependent dehydrogenase
MPAGVAVLKRLGIEVEGAPFRGIRYHFEDRSVGGEFPNQEQGLGIRRWHLDAALFAAARAEPNVECITGAAVEAPVFTDNRVAGVRANGKEYRADLTVAADGANSILRHKLGWDASTRTRRHGIVQHFRVPEPAPDLIHAYLGHAQETYVTPLPNQELLVGSLGDHPAIPAMFARLEPIGPPRGAAPLAVKASQRFGPGCVLLGDAAGSCDPITGGGVSQALLSAELLAEHAESLDVFDREREAMLANYRRLTAGVLALVNHPALIRPALSVLDHSPRLFSRLMAIAGGSA